MTKVEFANGMTVAELKRLVADWPETDEYGELLERLENLARRCALDGLATRLGVKDHPRNSHLPGQAAWTCRVAEESAADALRRRC